MRLEFYVLDVSYEIVGKEPHIVIWGVTRTGERILVRDKRFRPYFYAILGQEANPEEVAKKIRSLSKADSPITHVEIVDKRFFGKPVKALKITTTIPESVRDYREKVRKIPGIIDVVEADIRFSMRYVLDHDIHPCGWHVGEVVETKVKPSYRVTREYELVGQVEYTGDSSPPSDLRVMAFDIEVLTETGTPHPNRDPVIIIGIATNDGFTKQFVADGASDAKVIDEFRRFMLEYDPDVIVGYNSNRFDWPYLVERSKFIGTRLDVGRRIDGEPTTSTYGHVSIPGRLNVDLLDYVEEIPEIKLKSLDVVADYLGVMKREERVIIDYSEFPAYWRNPNKRNLLLKYNMDDVISTLKLATKFLPFAMQLANLTRLPLDQVGTASVGNRLEWFLMYEAYKRGELVPNRVEKEVETYKGAVVLKPQPGIHANIAVLDFTSMYPNIMIKYNVGPDTLDREGVCDPNHHNIAPEVGHCFKKEPHGFFKNVLSMLLTLRKKIKEEMKKYPVGSPEYILLDERQKAVKILANAAYGYMGWAGARWYCRECAEAITAWGRHTIMEAIELAQGLGLKVIYGDTDSLFVENDRDKVEKLIKLVEEHLGFEIKVDKVYKRAFFTEAKKRYAGLLEDGRIDIVGFEAVRGDWAEIAKEVQEKVTEILLKEEDVNKAVAYVQSVISDLVSYRVPLNKLIIWKTLTKPLEEYKAEAPHVTAVRKLIKQGAKVEIGDKVGYIIVKGAGKISDRAEPYQFVKNPQLIDTSYYIERQIVPAAMRMLEYFGVTEDKLKNVPTRGKKSLFDYMK